MISKTRGFMIYNLFVVTVGILQLFQNCTLGWLLSRLFRVIVCSRTTVSKAVGKLEPIEEQCAHEFFYYVDTIQKTNLHHDPRGSYAVLERPPWCGLMFFFLWLVIGLLLFQLALVPSGAEFHGADF